MVCIPNLFAGIKTHKKNGVVQQHKPYLLLYALGKANKKVRLTSFIEISDDFLLFSKNNRNLEHITKKIHYPFVRLENDGLWEITKINLLKKNSSGDINQSDLVKKNIKGGFTQEVYDALVEDKNLIIECARLLLYKYFPAEQHQAILQFIQLEEPGNHPMRETAVIQALQAYYQGSCRYQGIVLTSRFLPDLQQLSTGLTRFLEQYEYWQEPGMPPAPDSTCKGRSFCDKAFHQERNGLIILEPENWLFEWPREERKGFWYQLGNHYGRYPVITLARDVDFTTSDLSSYFRAGPTALNTYRFWTSKYQLS